MSFSSLLQRIQKGLSTVELVHTSHPRWPLPQGPSIPHTLQISVLDSSFNPPTLAHLALANTAVSAGVSNGPGGDFDARLLLLSVRNADKQLKPGDATYEQRAHMIILLAQDLARTGTPGRTIPAASNLPSSHTDPAAHEPNVAVAIVDEPTFVGKSAILLDFLQTRISELSHPSSLVLPPPSQTTSIIPSPKLTFLMGTDTIVRLFAQRYYADEHAMVVALNRFFFPTEHDSRIICARRLDRGVRASKGDAASVEVQLPDLAQEIVSSDSLRDRIAFVDIGERECTYSSSEVREKIAAQDAGWRSMVTSGIADYIAAQGLYTA